MPQYKVTLKIPIWGYLAVGVLLALKVKKKKRKKERKKGPESKTLNI